jgi:dTDP-4-amino-4,6-dideoxy-D-glucose acyltransferase
MALLTREQLSAMGFASIGEQVFISDKASFYGCSQIHIGSHVRIDDFAVLSAGEGGIEIGNYIHIAVYSSLIGAGKIRLADYCNISSRVSIYSSSDDYSGETMTNPMVPEHYKAVQHAPVTLEKHVIVGCGSVILPGVTLSEGAAVGALSLINQDCNAFSIYAGHPAILIKARKNNLLSLAELFQTKDYF